jgi:hypothetical protein
MKKSKISLRSSAAVMLSLAVALTHSSALLARGTGRAVQQTGSMTVRGKVYLNGYEARTGATVTDRSTIRTECDAAAFVVIGRSRIEIGPGSEVELRVEKGLVGAIAKSGRVIVRPEAGVRSVIDFTGGRTESAGDDPATLDVEYGAGTTLVSAFGGPSRVTAAEGQVFNPAVGEILRFRNSVTTPACPPGLASAQNPNGGQTPGGGVQPIPPPSPAPSWALPLLVFFGAVAATGATVAAVRAGNTTVVSPSAP